jgi:hypothetical protein
VHGIAHPAVQAGSDEAPRRVPWPRRAPPDGRERPQAPEVQGSPQDDDGYRVLGRWRGPRMAVGQDPPGYQYAPSARDDDGKEEVPESQAHRYPCRHGTREEEDSPSEPSTR